MIGAQVFEDLRADDFRLRSYHRDVGIGYAPCERLPYADDGYLGVREPDEDIALPHLEIAPDLGRIKVDLLQSAAGNRPTTNQVATLYEPIWLPDPRVEVGGGRVYPFEDCRQLAESRRRHAMDSVSSLELRVTKSQSPCAVRFVHGAGFVVVRLLSRRAQRTLRAPAPPRVRETDAWG